MLFASDDAYANNTFIVDFECRKFVDEWQEMLETQRERKARTEKNWPAIRAEHQNHFPRHQPAQRQRFQRKEILRNHARDWPARTHDQRVWSKRREEVSRFLKRLWVVG